MIEMKNVSKVYGNGITAIHDLSVQIEQGEFVYVVGPSGAGKSTFMRLMYREVLPTKGTVSVGDFDINEMKEKNVPFLRRQVGVVFQDFKLLPTLTVFENIAYAMEVLEKSTRQIEARVEEVLKLVKLEHKTDMYPNELSGGEQQRVAIARAIANMPRVLVADEPTGNLDPDTSAGIMKILETINAQGTTIIMATHNSEIVNKYKHRVIVIDDGRITRDEEKGGYTYEN
ncbi:cell division ATP-binding protein FtsE [Atopostipes suicloacalis DSM 15692]|uniref:Cell division ATP-binding protein FtsE n=1 Tax=Atopostipes suicloacalis DSM 15692 TaxID=1121025 RepID=A0A1M4S5N8_9LACT|nr:cell division ATP-binding protein FtsE [Atopostipes suicloacalis]SHE27515.1 cell division ATP-binding protein FtsE [Atopostipes suicloacalis DSM 15692]